MNTLQDFLASASIGQAIQYGSLTIFPLNVTNGHQAGYTTLDKALQTQQLQVSEVTEGGSVPDLHVSNKADQPVLMILGEELVGAKQNRTLNTTILVPAEAELDIPVTCVEQGRWAYRSRLFDSSGHTSHSKLRQSKMESTTRSLHAGSGYRADQSEVWGEVMRSMDAHSSSSPTHAMHDTYQQQAGNLKAYVDALADLNGAHGVVAVIGNEVVGADIFDTPETLADLWPKLARSYALDALETDRTAPINPERGPEQAASSPDTALEFLQKAMEAQQETFASVGLGQDVRLTSEAVIGSGLVWNEQVVHVNLFRRETPPLEQPR